MKKPNFCSRKGARGKSRVDSLKMYCYENKNLSTGHYVTKNLSLVSYDLPFLSDFNKSETRWQNRWQPLRKSADNCLLTACWSYVFPLISSLYTGNIQITQKFAIPFSLQATLKATLQAISSSRGFRFKRQYIKKFYT